MTCDFYVDKTLQTIIYIVLLIDQNLLYSIRVRYCFDF